MFRTTKLNRWIAPAAGVVLMLGLGQAMIVAAPVGGTEKTAVPAAAATSATITVNVVDQDAKPVTNAKLTVTPAHAKKSATATTTTATDGGKPAKPMAVASGVTDGSGKAVLTNIPDGKFVISAKLKGAGNSRETITIADGKDVSVTLTLKPKAAGKTGKKKSANQ